jgi:hypothetical protein
MTETLLYITLALPALAYAFALYEASPARCKTKGHKMREGLWRAYLKPSNSHYSVADRATVRCRVCARCGHADEPSEVLDRQSIQSLTMPTENHSLLRANGFVIMEKVSGGAVQ